MAAASALATWLSNEVAAAVATARGLAVDCALADTTMAGGLPAGAALLQQRVQQGADPAPAGVPEPGTCDTPGRSRSGLATSA